MTSSIHSQCRAKDAAQSCTSCFLRADQGYWRSTWPAQPWHSVFVLLTNRRPAAMLACSAKAHCIPEASPAKPRIPRCLRAPHPIVFIPFNIPVLFCKHPAPLRIRSALRVLALSGYIAAEEAQSPLQSSEHTEAIPDGHHSLFNAEPSRAGTPQPPLSKGG